MDKIKKSQNTYLFKSDIELTGILIITICSIGVSWIIQIAKNDITIWGLVLICVLILYLLMAIFHSRYYFYETYYVHFFLFRPFCKKKIVKYDKINKVQYKDLGTMGQYPKFVVYFRRKQYYTYNNSFVFRKHVKRVHAVDFLLSKGVEMYVRSDFDKSDKEIIDMVKKKYPNNVRLYP